jgi:UDPglucose--hexose-1-phosphate uridylyltransferase
VPEIRYNVVTREWVIIATERAKRPEQFSQQNVRRPKVEPYVATCPFCPGNEHLTPPETYRVADDGKWRLRVVPNKFAALDRDAKLTRSSNGLKRTISGAGIHEVIIETPAHDMHMALLSQPDFDRVIQTYRERYNAISKDSRVAHTTLFRTHGERAGTSLEHPHSQIVGTPIIAPQVRGRMETALRYYDDEGQCLGCAMIEEEMRDAVRIVTSNDRFVSIIPFAALSPFQLWVLPVRHGASFGDCTDEDLASLSQTLRLVLRKICFSLANPDYNLSVRSVSHELGGSRYHHWYVSVIARVSRLAGFELGSGKFLREASPDPV